MCDPCTRYHVYTPELTGEPMADLLFLPDWLTAHQLTVSGELPLQYLDPKRISTDTRALQPGDIYMPLKGAHFDGHAFVTQAFEAGAQLAFCDQSWLAAQAALPGPVIAVPDTLWAYQSLATAWRRQLGIPVVAVTGSSGKTSTKEILKQVLLAFFQVHATAENFNNEVGVPKTLLALAPEHEVCIVEMGMRGLGQIAELCEIAQPDIGVITNIGPVHLSELGSQANIVKAKWELADYLAAHEGVLVLNAENPLIAEAVTGFNGRVLNCGKASGHALRLLALEPVADGQWLTWAYADGSQAEGFLDLAGEHQALNLLCALGVLEALGKRLPQAYEVRVPRLFGRQQRFALANGVTLVNDAYNANPDSMRAALQVLAQSTGQRRLAVLGKMAELGPEASRFHFELGQYCDSLGLEQVLVIGQEALPLFEGIQQTPKQAFADCQAAVAYLQAALLPGDEVLVKASRSAGLEEVVDALVAANRSLE